ncbi:MAG: histidine kinase, partial [Thermoleophilia bacterium]|nr:histidine kinase [Thermoleophilia bacterium]
TICRVRATDERAAACCAISPPAHTTGRGVMRPRTAPIAPLPQAPTAHAPAGMTADGAAHAAWRPNVFTWVATWRVLITLEAAVALVTGLSDRAAFGVVIAAAVWAAISALAVVLPRPHGIALRSLLILDLVVCIALLAFAPDEATLSLLAAYACSTVVSWAAGRPADAFVAGGACALAYAVLALHGTVDAGRGGFTGTVSLFFFFALATSGFFTVARRIGALEIATEISRERGRYRRDLHDRLGQALSGMHFEVQAVHAVGLDDQAPARLASLADGYRDALRTLRDLFRVGDEPMVGTNVASVIRQEARRMGQQANVRVDVETTGDASRVPPWMRPHVVAVAGESVNNAVKNGRASDIAISIDVTENLVVLSISDDGVGFDNPPGTITEKDGHYGLREMAERARICGGEVVIASQPGFGTRVRLQIPLPDDAAEDMLERDASRLRDNVWSLVGVLRVGLGVVAVAQLAIFALHDAHSVGWLLLALVVLDLALGLIFSRRARNSLQRDLRGRSALALPVTYIAVVAALFGAATWSNAPPAFLVYAPLLLLAVGIADGRRSAAHMTALFVVALGVVATVTRVVGVLTDRELEGALVHVTDVTLVGMAAIQGAKLLDRLEALQIRVRYQALARLRHGLSGRMRDQLTERLEELEQLARSLAASPPDAVEFTAATQRMQDESTQLKARLRDIVHTLADPTPTSAGRTPTHV